MADMGFPKARHDGTAWDPDRDKCRLDKAGLSFKFKSILLRIKGDWEEFCSRLGFPNWASSLRPCFCCAASGDDLFDVSEVSVLSLHWHLNTTEDYEIACSRCEIWVIVADVDMRNLLGHLLDYDKRKDGQRGRCLTADIPSLSLLAQDRLEPSCDLMDVGDFESIVPPKRVLFWRTSRETICNHRCPIFCDRIGINPNDTIALDLLHTLFLGPMLAWSRYVMWKLILSTAFGAHEKTEHERLQIGLKIMKAELYSWYEAHDRLHPETRATRVADLKPGMLGTKDSPKLKLKAMECYWMSRFLVDAVHKYRVHIADQYQLLYDSGSLLRQYVELLKSAPMNLSPSQLQASTGLWCRFMTLIRPLDIYTPKAHLMIHVNHRTRQQGNPWRYTTFLDESLNKELKKVLRNVHQSNFETLAYAKLGQVLADTCKRQRVVG